MMNIKNIFQHSVIWIILLSTVACEEDFLEEKMYSQLGPANFYKTEKDAIAALNGVYDGFQADTYYGRGIWNLTDYPTEMFFNFWHNDFDRYTLEDDEANTLYPFWQHAWEVNNRANAIINRIPDIYFNDENDKNRMLGEARFLRALNYFNMVRFFGHIPLITSETTAIDENQLINQVPRDSVFQQIIKDLQFAEAQLPEVQQDAGRATSGAAKTLLGKVYLTLAGYLLNYETGELQKGDPAYYQKAADKLKEVIDSKVYRLEENFAKVFSVDNANNDEIIFAIQYLEGTGGYTGGEGNSWTPIWIPKGAGIAMVEWHITATPIEFYNSYPVNDLRRDATFMISYVNADGATVSYPDPPLTAPHLRKFLSDIHEGPNPSFSAVDGKDYGCDFPVLRYADVLLMYSEVLNELNAPDALWGINEVRERAGIDALIMTDQETLRGQILQERKWEFTGEAQGWFDYVRMGVLTEPANSLGHKQGYLYPTNRNYLFPIPFTAKEINTNLVQNVGW